MKPLSRLLYADSERCADLAYATGFFAPDPFIYVEHNGQAQVIVSSLEVARARAEAKPSLTVLSLADAKTEYTAASTKAVDLIASVSAYHQHPTWTVPADFPLGMARELTARGVDLAVMSPFFPERSIKSEAEIEALRQGVALAEAGLNQALAILADATIDGDAIIWHDTPLTAERLRGEIDATISRLGGIAAHTIVAPGIQGADPHQAGHGPLWPHQPLVIDIFPRVCRTGYFGDLTRTVVKGQASSTVQQAFAAVRTARDAAKAMVCAGVNGHDIHRGVVANLTGAGFVTETNTPQPYGFIHGTGHGLGLEIHESPRISAIDETLAAGHVVTVEPGVYYPDWGGMRLEDVVVVTDQGCETLTTVDTFLEIN